jgi:hypothetical protein
MSILHKYALVKMRLGADVPSFPPLLRGFKEIPKRILASWLGIVALQILSVEKSGGYSLASLLVFIVLTVMIFPVLTYVAVYKVSSSSIKGLVTTSLISKWMSSVSSVTLFALVITIIGIEFNIPYLGSYILSPAVFSLLMLTSWIRFRKEIKMLAKARDFIMGKYNQHSSPFNSGCGLIDDPFEVNPANGLPMVNTAVDVLGNLRGIDSNGLQSDDICASRTDSHLPYQATESINPASGLPMIDSTFDVQGNTWGSATNDHQDIR